MNLDPLDRQRRNLLRGLTATAALSVAGVSGAADGVIRLPTVRLLDGASFTPQVGGGQALVVVFWATYCPFCARHNAHVDKLYRQTRGLPIQILTAATDTDPNAVRAYMERNSYAFPVTLDSAALRAPLSPRKVIPLTCCVDRNGVLRPVVPGEMFEEDVLDLAKLAA
ncbi:MAG: TlpA family protein disulfide reductase [Gammaproteobacteria bacterium]|nr:TlpA family protein disulfide reductase [Gammaproteobacteria bacterium]MBU1440779.1 TlpA family protein disulfide reductase [Gammaproteobacteria bacterium]MBU2287766.1 TlpA family protein disulfide reductase [Gammaproteobacteria bacterium]